MIYHKLQFFNTVVYHLEEASRDNNIRKNCLIII